MSTEQPTSTEKKPKKPTRADQRGTMADRVAEAAHVRAIWGTPENETALRQFFRKENKVAPGDEAIVDKAVMAFFDSPLRVQRDKLVPSEVRDELLALRTALSGNSARRFLGHEAANAWQALQKAVQDALDDPMLIAALKKPSPQDDELREAMDRTFQKSRPPHMIAKAVRHRAGKAFRILTGRSPTYDKNPLFDAFVRDVKAIFGIKPDKLEFQG